MQKTDRVFLKIAGFTTLFIGAYHFILPAQWHWKNSTQQLPGMISWGLFSINFFFSSLLVLLGLFTLKIVFKNPGTKIDFSVLLIAGICWTVNFFYQVFVPLPLPKHLISLKIIFLLVAFFNTCFYLIPLYRAYKHLKKY